MGPHGCDWLIGTWNCNNSMPSPMGGPAATTATVARGRRLTLGSLGPSFDAVGYVAYAPKTKTWWNPTAMADGDSSSESSMQTGKQTLWTGTFFDAETGKTNAIRDTYTIASATSFKDLSQAQTGGAWKTIANTTCTKSP
jgi:hypothetical protein